MKALLKAIEIYTDMGRFTMAAKQHQSIAEMYETEFVDFDKAIYHYQQAADYYRGEESNASANKCLLKVAQYSAQLENYSKAIEIYEAVNILCSAEALRCSQLSFVFLLLDFEIVFGKRHVEVQCEGIFL